MSPIPLWEPEGLAGEAGLDWIKNTTAAADESMWDEHYKGSYLEDGVVPRDFYRDSMHVTVTSRSTSNGETMKGLQVAAGLLVAVIAAIGLTGCSPAVVSQSVKNDLAVSVELAACDDDPVTVESGQTVSVHPLATDLKASCFVYKSDGPTPVGCLRLEPRGPSLVSAADPPVGVERCGEILTRNQ